MLGYPRMVDPDGNEVYEEWELDECGDSEEQHEDESDEEEDTPCNTPDCEGSN